MDSQTHPVVQQGIRAADLISDVSHAVNLPYYIEIKE